MQLSGRALSQRGTGHVGSSSAGFGGVHQNGVIQDSAPKDEAGNKEQGPGPREQGCNKVDRKSLGHRTHPHPIGERAREPWEPKIPRKKKVASSEGRRPTTAQHPQLLGRVATAVPKMPLHSHHPRRCTLAPTHMPVSRAQDPAPVCWLGCRGGQLSRSWTGMGCLTGRLPARVRRWLRPGSLRCDDSGCPHQVMVNIPSGSSHILKCLPPSGSGCPFYPAHVWEAPAFSGGSLIRARRVPHPLHSLCLK